MLQYLQTFRSEHPMSPLPVEAIFDLDVWALGASYDHVALNPAGAALEYAALIEYMNDLTIELAWVECNADFCEWATDKAAVQADLVAMYAAQQHMLVGGGLFAQALGGAA